MVLLPELFGCNPDKWHHAHFFVNVSSIRKSRNSRPFAFIRGKKFYLRLYLPAFPWRLCALARGMSFSLFPCLPCFPWFNLSLPFPLSLFSSPYPPASARFPFLVFPAAQGVDGFAQAFQQVFHVFEGVGVVDAEDRKSTR